MARTPLLRRMRSLALRVRAAEAHGLPARAILDQPRGPTRRELLAGAAAAGALFGLAGCATPPRRNGARVVIVGAGLAGLVAAHRLRQRGIEAELREASPRAGGRVSTDDTSFAPLRVERGGELIDSGHERLFALMDELGLERDNLLEAEAPGTQMLAWLDGQRVTEADAAADFVALWPALVRDVTAAGGPVLYDDHTPGGAALDALSIAEWIDSRVDGGLQSRLGRLLDAAYAVEYGTDTGELSAMNLVSMLGTCEDARHFELFGESDEAWRVRGGNERVVATLAARLQEQLMLGQRLVAARTAEDGRVQLVFDTPGGREELVADRVILTVPFAVLRAGVDLTELQLQPRKRAAILELGMATHGKLHLEFTDRAWVRAGGNGETYAPEWGATWEESRSQPGVEGLLVNFCGGARGAGLGGRPPLQSAQELLPALDALFPGLPARFTGRCSVDAWAGSPFQRGSYSYWRTGQCVAIAGVEGEAEGHVHFAGEHTSTDYQGFMEGAVESGERAAAEVADSL